MIHSMPFKLSFILLFIIIKSLRLSLIISYFFISLSLSSVIGFTDFSVRSVFSLSFPIGLSPQNGLVSVHHSQRKAQQAQWAKSEI